MKSKDYYLSKPQSAKNVGISSRLTHQKDFEGRSQKKNIQKVGFDPSRGSFQVPENLLVTTCHTLLFSGSLDLGDRL